MIAKFIAEVGIEVISSWDALGGKTLTSSVSIKERESLY